MSLATMVLTGLAVCPCMGLAITDVTGTWKVDFDKVWAVESEKLTVFPQDQIDAVKRMMQATYLGMDVHISADRIAMKLPGDPFEYRRITRFTSTSASEAQLVIGTELDPSLLSLDDMGHLHLMLVQGRARTVTVILTRAATTSPPARAP